MRRLRLVQRQSPFPLPVHHRRVVSLRLLDLIFRLARQALRRHHVFDPVLDRNLDRVGFPIGLVLGDLVLLAAEPIDGPPHQLVRGDRRIHQALPVRQLHQRTHDVRLAPLNLKGVVDAPEAPHSSHVVLRNVTVEQELTGQPLQAARTPFNNFIIDLRRPDGLHIEAIGRTGLAEVFHAPGKRGGTWAFSLTGQVASPPWQSTQPKRTVALL